MPSGPIFTFDFKRLIAYTMLLLGFSVKGKEYRDSRDIVEIIFDGFLEVKELEKQLSNDNIVGGIKHLILLSN